MGVAASQFSFPRGFGSLAGFPEDAQAKSPHPYLPAAPAAGQRVDDPGPQLRQHARTLCVPTMSA